ncbi:hypothetical protein BH11ACT7_BH11ACT7_11950 [soil metagenome]
MLTKRSAKPKEQPADGERTASVRDRRARGTGTGGKKPRRPDDTAPRRAREAGARKDKGAKTPSGRAPSRETRKAGTPPGHAPATTPVRRPAPAKNTSQAKARAKARKAKAPKVVRIPLRERLLIKLTAVDLRPQALAARVPFVVLVIGALGVGLAVTLWLSTDAAERSYQLGSAQQTNQALLQQKEALERDVLEAQAAPALAEAARGLGMIPSRDTAHLVQDPAGNWIVVGRPKPAKGAPPPTLNAPLPEDTPAPRPRPVPAGQGPADTLERSIRITPGVPNALGAPVVPGTPLAVGAEVPVRVPAPGTLPAPVDPEHAPAALPGVPLPGPLPGPAPEALAAPMPAPLPAPLPGPDPAAAALPLPLPLPADPAILPPPVPGAPA